MNKRGALNAYVFVIVLGIVLVLAATLSIHAPPFEALESTRSATQNQHVLLSVLSATTERNQTVLHELALDACATPQPGLFTYINNSIRALVTNHYIFQANNEVLFDKDAQVNLTHARPARVNFNTPCNTNLSITFGAYYEYH